jgi:hypothetical protein
MKCFSRSLLPALLALPITILFVPGARAQMDCGQCTPYSSCDESCTICAGIEYIDGGCSRYEYTTCGDAGGYTYGCMQSNCTPWLLEVSRDNRGTYGNGSVFSCSHHRVDWVTKHDYNQCNTNSYYWDISSCEDTVDGGKSGFNPDCCNGYGPNGTLDSTYTCNHQHNC